MIAKLEFNLPEEDELFKIHTNAVSTHGLVQEFDNFLRSRYKHVELDEGAFTELQIIRDQWLLLTNDLNI